MPKAQCVRQRGRNLLPRGALHQSSWGWKWAWRVPPGPLRSVQAALLSHHPGSLCFPGEGGEWNCCHMVPGHRQPSDHLVAGPAERIGSWALSLILGTSGLTTEWPVTTPGFRLSPANPRAAGTNSTRHLPGDQQRSSPAGSEENPRPEATAQGWPLLSPYRP